jgi:hypothetical protein
MTVTARPLNAVVRTCSLAYAAIALKSAIEKSTEEVQPNNALGRRCAPTPARRIANVRPPGHKRTVTRKSRKATDGHSAD